MEAMKTVWLALILAVFSTSCTPKKKDASPTAIAAKSFALESTAKKKVRLEDFAGKPVLVHFWASWCPPCIGELPVLVRAAKALEASGLVVVAISLDKTWAEADRVFPKIPLSANFVSLLDPSSKSAEDWGSYNFPETYLVDKSQKIVTKWVGPQEWESQEFRDFLKPYL